MHRKSEAAKAALNLSNIPSIPQHWRELQESTTILRILDSYYKVQFKIIMLLLFNSVKSYLPHYAIAMQRTRTCKQVSLRYAPPSPSEERILER